MKLSVHHITNNDDFNVYLNKVSSFDVMNPFYAIYGANLSNDLFEALHYFTFSTIDSNELLILMPFVLRKVPVQFENKTYYDVISPYGYSGPLYNESMSRGYLIHFWEAVDAWYQENNVVSEFMRFSLNHNHQFYNGILVPTLTNVRGHILEPDLQWQSFKQKVRNNYRKSKHAGLEARFYRDSLDEKALVSFYKIYTETMTRIGADSSYFYTLNYFKKLISLSHNNFVLVLIFKDELPISGELILIAGNTLYSYLGGTLSDYFQYRPNDFLKLEVMRWAFDHGFVYYLLGGGRQDGDSLYHYKKSFFVNDPDVIYYTGRKIINTKVYNDLDVLLNATVIIYKKNTKPTDTKLNKNSLDYFPSYRKFQLEKK
jgi:hypothetical protein